MDHTYPPRLPDWRTNLVAYLHEAARRPFEEGVHDCALFLAGGVQAMTSYDYAFEYRGKYTTTKGGLKLLRAAGYADHVDLARTALRSKPVAMACEGDGAVISDGSVAALGIVQGSSIYVLRSAGLGLVPLTAATYVLEV